MCGKARYAWHGVPKILPNTCPPELASWPAPPGSDRGEFNGDDAADLFEAWRNWLDGKRINLNVRQMTD